MRMCTVGGGSAAVCALTYRRLAFRVPTIAVLMEPALWQEIESGPADEEVGIIIRMAPGVQPPPNVRVSAQFEATFTARILRGDIVMVRQSPGVVSVKASTRVILPGPLESARETVTVTEDLEYVEDSEDVEDVADDGKGEAAVP